MGVPGPGNFFETQNKHKPPSPKDRRENFCQHFTNYRNSDLLVTTLILFLPKHSHQHGLLLVGHLEFVDVLLASQSMCVWECNFKNVCCVTTPRLHNLAVVRNRLVRFDYCHTFCDCRCTGVSTMRVRKVFGWPCVRFQLLAVPAVAQVSRSGILKCVFMVVAKYVTVITLLMFKLAW